MVQAVSRTALWCLKVRLGFAAAGGGRPCKSEVRLGQLSSREGIPEGPGDWQGQAASLAQEPQPERLLPFLGIAHLLSPPGPLGSCPLGPWATLVGLSTLSSQSGSPISLQRRKPGGERIPQSGPQPCLPPGGHPAALWLLPRAGKSGSVTWPLSSFPYLPQLHALLTPALCLNFSSSHS